MSLRRSLCAGAVSGLVFLAQAAACSTGDRVSIGPDQPAGVVVCLDPSLTRDETRVFRQERFLAGEFGNPPIENYAAQGGDSLNFDGGSDATEAERRAMLSKLRSRPEVTSVAEGSTVVDECRSGTG